MPPSPYRPRCLLKAVGSRVVPFVWTNIQQAYPQGTLGWIWVRRRRLLRRQPLIVTYQLDNHATAPWFLRQPVGQRYDFLWQMERDLRMVGGSWVQWYNVSSDARTGSD